MSRPETVRVRADGYAHCPAPTPVFPVCYSPRSLETSRSRLLHILKRNSSSHDEPGIRCDAYKLDYGCYVDLMATTRAPQGLFEDFNSHVDVPAPQGLFNFLHKQALAPKLRQRSATISIPCGGAHRNFCGESRGMRAQRLGNPTGLPESQWAPPSAKTHMGGLCCGCY